MEPNSNKSNEKITAANKSSGKRQSDSKCLCTNISIMQLFHQMKQDFPTVPDQIVSQLVNENCHNRDLCLELLKKEESKGHSISGQSYPTHSIQASINNCNNKSSGECVNVTGTSGSSINNQIKQVQLNETFLTMKKISDNDKNSKNSSNFSQTSNIKSVSDNLITNPRTKRPTTLSINPETQQYHPFVLRRAPPPPIPKSSFSSTSSSQQLQSISNVTNNNKIVSSQSTVPQLKNDPQSQVLLDSQAIKTPDSLNVQLNVTVSPISSTGGLPPIPPRPPPLKPPRHTSHLNVQPDLPYSSMLDSNNNQLSAGASGSGTVSMNQSGPRSYTSVNFVLRQPAGISPSQQMPIDIQASPSCLTYSSSSFDAKQGYQSHLKITVAGNGESCISAVRTKSPMSPLSGEIDTTVNIGEPNEGTLVRIPQTNKRPSGLSESGESN